MPAHSTRKASASVTPLPFLKQAHAFVLRITRRAAHDVTITIRHAASQAIVVEWRGETARHLLESQPLKPTLLHENTRALSNAQVKTLTLAAAAMNMAAASECPAATEALKQRLAERGLRLPCLHRRIAAVLFEHPGKHFDQTEATCAVLLQHPMLCEARVSSALDQLAAWSVLQRIEVGDCVFYDIDTSPHLHVYCERTQQLFDAPLTGVVRST